MHLTVCSRKHSLPCQLQQRPRMHCQRRSHCELLKNLSCELLMIQSWAHAAHRYLRVVCVQDAQRSLQQVTQLPHLSCIRQAPQRSKGEATLQSAQRTSSSLSCLLHVLPPACTAAVSSGHCQQRAYLKLDEHSSCCSRRSSAVRSQGTSLVNHSTNIGSSNPSPALAPSLRTTQSLCRCRCWLTRRRSPPPCLSTGLRDQSPSAAVSSSPTELSAADHSKTGAAHSAALYRPAAARAHGR